MPPDVRVTAAVAKVLAAFLEDPSVDRYGLDLMRATGQPSGTLYPILTRLQRAGSDRRRVGETRPGRGRPATAPLLPTDTGRHGGGPRGGR